MSVFMRALIAIVVLTVVTGCTPLPQAAPPASTTDFHVTPVEAAPGDLDGLLEVSRWKFQLALPQPTPDPRAAPQDEPTNWLTYRLEVRQTGQVPRVLIGGTFGQPHFEEELEVIMFPIDQPDGQPERWKVWINGVRSVIDSPRESDQSSARGKLAERLPDGSFLLMEMGKGTFPSPDNAQLVFSVTEEEQP